MRPIIEYHGSFFQGLCRLVMRLDYENASLIWQSGALIWLLLLGALTFTKRFAGLFTGLVITGVLLLRLPALGLVEQNVDEGQWIVSAATLVHDPRFWQSVDGTTSGPFNVWPPALMYYLGFSLDYTTLRLWGLATCVVPTVWLLLATFRRQFSERIARLAILPIAACLALTTDPDGVAFNSEQLPMMLLALTGYLLSRLFIGATLNRSRHLIYILTLGFILGSLPYTKLQVTPTGLLIAVWVLAGLLVDLPQRVLGWFRHLGEFVIGGLLPTVLIGIYLLATGLTDYAFRSYLLANLGYAQSGSWEAGTVSWLDRVLIRLPQIYGSMPSTSWFWVLALMLGLSGFNKIRLLPGRGRQPANKLWFILSACIVSLYTTLQPGNPFPHYQWLSFVPVSWLIGELLNRLFGPASLLTSQRQWEWGILCSYMLVSAGYPVWLAVSRPNPGIQQLAAGGWKSSSWAVSEQIKQLAKPNERMVVWGWANYLHVETGLLMGSRFIPLYFPVMPGSQQAYFLTVYQQDLLRNRPAIIVDALGLHPGHGYDRYPIRRYPAIQSILNQRYELAATVGGAKIYALRQ